jgi:uncharacterized membrane protein
VKTTRLEAFSDGVIAILITIMVLELKVPHEADAAALRPLLPTFLSYVLSFIFIGIYWGNHHHMIHATSRVTGGILWANLHLLFWLSLVPFATGWMGESWPAPLPTATYGGVLLAAAIAYTILQHLIVRNEGPDSKVARVFRNNLKGNISPFFYVGGIGLSFVRSWLAAACYVTVALIWLVPDRRVEKNLEE